MKIVDMHCDTISELFQRMKDKRADTLAKNELHIDIEKMKKGDYLLQNFAMFVDLNEREDALFYCLELIDLYYRQMELNQEVIAPVFCYEDIERNKKDGKMSALLTIEEGGVTRGSLAHLRNFYRLGVRMLTLTWNHENGIGYPNVTIKDGRPDWHTPNTADGLTDFGLEFIQEMENIGMIIDVSHLSDAGFYQVLAHTTKPFVASHSNARSICPHVRNLTDDMIYKLSGRGGVMGMNFYPAFLGEDADAGTIKAIVKNILHIRNVGGYECIGLGSDFDGIPGHDELKDSSCMPLLAEALEKAGLSNHEIEAVFYKNVLRVYKELL
ncbi:dipeptidase [Anaerocolumna xylanovorans]|uniref:Membrane dipeptidase n=1 Tax=Anaerocolumna xylanovorans DSM 12503 TaxID=1121345 RepID=A0A1M7YFN1_9FIRM|nr:dipeptidase [Anaerocolumna xylanovorans]SHO51442.1 membrane dipeptidase [Anaerocolumna xylanovorans DSM 12503]